MLLLLILIGTHAATDAGSHLGLPTIVSDLMSRRRSTTDGGLARACKLIANSIYGQLASQTSPLYDPESANAITAEGRRHLSNLVKHLGCCRGRVVYGDTDSCMVTFDACTDADECEARARACAETFNRSLPSPMRVVVQDIFVKSVFLSKKKYVAKLRDGGFHYTGTINIRSDSPPEVKKQFEIITQTVLHDACTEQEVSLALGNAMQAMSVAPAEQMCALRKLTTLNAAGTIQPHIELARTELFREQGLGYTSDDSIEYVPCRPLPRPKTAPARNGTWVCETIDVARNRDIEWRSLWKPFFVASIALVSAVMGEDRARLICERFERDKTVPNDRMLFTLDDDDAPIH